MITWHVTNPFECYYTSVTQLSWSTRMKRRWTVLKDKITVTELLLVNLSRSDYFFHHIVLVLSHMESNQIPFFLVSSGTNQVGSETVSPSIGPWLSTWPKVRLHGCVISEMPVNPTNPKSNKYQILKIKDEKWEKKLGLYRGHEIMIEKISKLWLRIQICTSGKPVLEIKYSDFSLLTLRVVGIIPTTLYKCIDYTRTSSIYIKYIL